MTKTDCWQEESSADIVSTLRQLQSNQVELTDQIIFALSSAVEAKDRYTNGHSLRVANYTLEIARRLDWSEEQLRRIYYAALLHDVGKIRVPDTIINKTEMLDNQEREQMKLYTLAGYYILKEISAIADFAIGARWHHERYDGKGYPNGLSGKNIPLISRIISVADAYDAMTSNRSYRSILPQDKVREQIVAGSGTQFDPDIAKIMVAMIDDDVNYTMRQPENATQYTLLAIDDEPMVHKLLQFTLKDHLPQYNLISALSGEEGLRILQSHKIDLVLLDVEMPQMDGFDVLETIRKSDKLLPVVFMTGDKEMEIIQKAEAMGVNDYLTKPLVKHVLLESIQNVLSHITPSHTRD